MKQREENLSDDSNVSLFGKPTTAELASITKIKHRSWVDCVAYFSFFSNIFKAKQNDDRS